MFSIVCTPAATNPFFLSFFVVNPFSRRYSSGPRCSSTGPWCCSSRPRCSSLGPWWRSGWLLFWSCLLCFAIVCTPASTLTCSFFHSLSCCVVGCHFCFLGAGLQSLAPVLGSGPVVRPWLQSRLDSLAPVSAQIVLGSIPRT